MKSRTISIAPEYCGVYLAGATDVEVPLDLDRRGIATSGMCLNIRCVYWNDSDTKVTIGPAKDVARTAVPAFDGILNTPRRTVVLFDANVDEFLSSPVSSEETRVRIWTNHEISPDEIIIGLE